MKIEDVRVNVLKPISKPFVWREGWPPVQIQNCVVRVISDTGIEGSVISWVVTAGEMKEALYERVGYKEFLKGKDPWDREYLLQEMTALTGPANRPASYIDMALWDLCGKAVGLPVYKLLGAYRDKIRAYASTVTLSKPEDYGDFALQCREEGFTAFKLHAYGVPEKDIAACRAARTAVGDTMDLMLDPVNAYDRLGAMRVGRVLDELDFYWYEAPIRDEDIDGYVLLRRSLKTPIAGTETVQTGLVSYPQWVKAGAVDQIRSVGDFIGGITAMKKVAGFCEAHGLKYEPHSYGTASVQAAHMAVMLAIRNCDFVEIPVPQGILDVAAKDVIRVAKDGYVYASQKPGLGYDPDWDAVKELTVEEF